jgi:AraC family transcriptional regulator
MAEAFNVPTRNPWGYSRESGFSTLPPCLDFFSARSQARTARSQELRWRFDPPILARHIAEWEQGRGEVLTLVSDASCEMEFFSPAHLVLMLLDGSSAGCELSGSEGLRKVARLAPSAVLFNPADRYLRIRKKAQNRCRVLLIAIGPDYIQRLNNADFDVANIQFHQEIDLRDGAVRQTLSSFQEEIEHPGLNNRFYCEILTLLLLTQLIRCASNFAQPQRRAYIKGGLPNWRLKRALQMLDGNLSKPPALAELASHVGLHPSSFCRAFKQSIGVSPHRYLIEQRIDRAKKMMINQAMSLTQIALECGFKGSSQFSVAFRRITGITPRVYRNCL